VKLWPRDVALRFERFTYLTWGDVGDGNTFEMFRRAKLMLNRVDANLIRSAAVVGRLIVNVDLLPRGWSRPHRTSFPLDGRGSQFPG
jgi:Family of unknown function (DUF5990)